MKPIPMKPIPIYKTLPLIILNKKEELKNRKVWEKAWAQYVKTLLKRKLICLKKVIKNKKSWKNTLN